MRFVRALPAKSALADQNQRADVVNTLGSAQNSSRADLASLIHKLAREVGHLKRRGMGFLLEVRAGTMAALDHFIE